MGYSGRPVQTSSKIVGATLLLILVNLGIGGYSLLKKSSGPREEITTPLLAIRTLTAKSLYFTPQARSCLKANAPQMLTEDDKNEQSERSSAFTQALQNPVLWRKLDRQYHFDSILLCGDPVINGVLLKHLLDTGDWTLTYVDHTSLIFKRPPASPWASVDLDALQKKISSYPKADRITFQVQLAQQLSGINRYSLAKNSLEEALKLNPKSPETLTALAVYHAHFTQWNKALEEADAALAQDKKYQPAMVTRAQALLAMHRSDEAIKVTGHLMELAPKDMQILWLHAIVAHQAHDYTQEIAALKVLIDVAGQQQHATSGYRIYLGQAHAASGEALPALEQFQKALAAGDLSPEQTQFANEFIQRIKTRL